MRTLDFTSTRDDVDELDVEGIGMDVFETFFPAAALVTEAPKLLTRPSAASNQAFEQLKSGWRELVAWGASPFFPSDGGPSVVVHPDVNAALSPQIGSWFSFRAAWENGEPDTTALQAQAIDLEEAKNRAAEFGFPGAYHARTDTTARPGTDTRVHPPSVDEQSAALSAAQKTQDGVDAAKGAAKGIGDQIAKIPVGYKVGAIALVAGVVVIAVRSVVGR